MNALPDPLRPARGIAFGVLGGLVIWVAALAVLL